ncbi:RNA polymerase I enhancer binding protein, partial [Rhizophlyctis rosea]
MREEYKTFNKGPFTTWERQQIEHAVQHYIRLKSVPRDEFYMLCNRKIVHDKNPNNADSPFAKKNPYNEPYYNDFWKTIAETAKLNRCLNHIHAFMVRKYSMSRNDGKRWTKEEDEELRRYRDLGMKWSEIIRTLGRTGAKSRWITMMRWENDMNMGIWSPEENKIFAKACRDLMAEYEITDVWDFNHWQEVAAVVKTRDVVQCKEHFPGLIDKYGNLENVGEPAGSYNRDVWTRQDDLDLVTKLYTVSADFNDESDVNWDVLRGTGWRRWSLDKLKYRWMKMRSRVPNLDMLTFHEALQYCVEHINKVSRKPWPNDVVSQEFIFDSDEEDEEVVDCVGGEVAG